MPNFRAQLYAVPGMRGSFVFTATKTTKDVEAASHKTYNIDEIPALLEQPAYSELTIDIDEHSDKANKDKTGWRYVANPTAKRPTTIIRDQATFGPGVVEKLKAAGITQVTAHLPGYLDIACAKSAASVTTPCKAASSFSPNRNTTRNSPQPRMWCRKQQWP